MRRAPIVITASIAGTVAVLSFKPREPALPSVASAATATAEPAPTSPSTATTKPGANATTPATGTKTATGDAISTRYGNAQVRVTITNGKITNVEAVQLQGSDPKSVQISSSAEPALRQSALAKQSAAIDAVSGATITSASYEASLQSALDKAGFKAADGSRGSSEIPQVQEGHGGPRDGGPPPQFFIP
jgi:uncharacterized protein with FMN-binding domain